MSENDSSPRRGASTTKSPAKSERSAETSASAREAEETAVEMTSRAADVMRDATAAGLAPMAAVSTNLTAELNNIDFRKMIGGPLQAAVDAQVASSLATID